MHFRISKIKLNKNQLPIDLQMIKFYNSKLVLSNKKKDGTFSQV